jgi:tetratricopeptide (TPR) repeat protein
MPETDDPRAALDSNDVTVRAAGARDLAAVGTYEDALRLIERARDDKSLSVRLCAAGAAADILFRVALAEPQRREVVRKLDGFDPGRNPSLAMVLAPVVDDEGIARLGRMVRDPRSEVRSAALAALKQMSTRPGAGEPLSAAVRAWLLEGRHPPDAVADLVRLTSEAGWPGMDEAIRAAAKKGRAAAEAVREAIDWIAARGDIATWVGVWAAIGSGSARITDWLYLEGGRVWGPALQGEGGARELGELSVADGVGSVAGLPKLYRVRTGRPSDDTPSEALKLDDRLLSRLPPREIARRFEALHPMVSSCPEASMGIARDLAPLEGAAAVRARAAALWFGGALQEAEQAVDALLAADAKPKPDLLWLAANVKLRLGDLDSAREAATKCLETAPKKASYRADAEALLASLGRGGA